MPQTYDQGPVSVLEDFGAADPTALGAEIFSNGAYRRCDSVGVYNPRTVWLSPHTTAPILAHFVNQWGGAALASTVTGQPFPSSIVWYYDSLKTKQALSAVYTRNGLQQATQIVYTTYATDGATVLNTCTDTINYSGAFEVSRTRTIT